jgi:hypothetical protein
VREEHRPLPRRQGVPVSIVDGGRKGLMVVVRQLLRPGDVAVVGRPVRVLAQRTRHSFQKDWDLHVDLDEPGRLMNHSCDPNTGVVDNEFGGYDFVALREIRADEELTWDYETTEYESIAVGRCLCGAAACRGRTAGYRYAYEAGRTPDYVAAYLIGQGGAVDYSSDAGVDRTPARPRSRGHR